MEKDKDKDKEIKRDRERQREIDGYTDWEILRKERER